MIYKLRYKSIIITLMIFLALAGGLLWYKEETTNKEAPKRAEFVENTVEWGKVYE